MTDYAPGIRLLDCSKLAINKKKMTMTSKNFNMTSSSNFFDVVLFYVTGLVTGLSFMSISLLVLDYDNFLS